MPAKGITISVTAETNSGGRRHMEDYLAVKLCPNEELRQIPELREQAYIGVFDGHGGKEAAKFARERLWDLIQSQPKFLATDTGSVREALAESFVALHHEMEPLRAKWKRNKMGDLSTAGTTASTVIFRQDQIFVANVGDSTIVLAVKNSSVDSCGEHAVRAQVLTKDHKPEDPEETRLIESLGGKVLISRKGVPRVVWERRRSKGNGGDSGTDQIPFLSVSRSLGDFWSYNSRTCKFAVSPQPDVSVLPLDPNQQKFVVIATDGLWNVMTPTEVVQFIWDYEHDSQQCHQPRDVVRAVINEALKRWNCRNLLADNIAVLIAFLTEEDEPTPSSISSLSDSAAPLTTGGESSCSEEIVAKGHPPSSETGVEGEVRENPVSPPVNVIQRMSKTKTGSTLYYKETLSEGVTIEYQTRIKLRQQRKDKRRPREVRAKGVSSRRLEGEKRPRESEEVEGPAVKRVRLDVDSGCEEGGPESEGGLKSSPLESDTSSSGVFSDGTSTEEGLMEHTAGLCPALPQAVEVVE